MHGERRAGRLARAPDVHLPEAAASAGRGGRLHHRRLPALPPPGAGCGVSSEHEPEQQLEEEDDPLPAGTVARGLGLLLLIGVGLIATVMMLRLVWWVFVE